MTLPKNVALLAGLVLAPLIALVGIASEPAPLSRAALELRGTLEPDGGALIAIERDAEKRMRFSSPIPLNPPDRSRS